MGENRPWTDKPLNGSEEPAPNAGAPDARAEETDRRDARHQGGAPDPRLQTIEYNLSIYAADAAKPGALDPGGSEAAAQVKQGTLLLPEPPIEHLLTEEVLKTFAGRAVAARLKAGLPAMIDPPPESELVMRYLTPGRVRPKDWPPTIRPTMQSRRSLKIGRFPALSRTVSVPPGRYPNGMGDEGEATEAPAKKTER